MSWNTIVGQEQQVRVLKKALSKNRLAHAYLFTGPDGTGKEAVAFEIARILNCTDPGLSPESGACDTCLSCIRVNRFMHPNIEYVFPVEAALLEQVDPSRKENKRLQEARERYQALIEEKKRNPYYSPAMERSMGILTDQVVMLQEKAVLSPREGGKKVFIISQAERLHPSAANKLLKLLEEPPPHVVFILVSSNPDAVLPTIRSRCQPVLFGRIAPAELESAITSICPEINDTERRFIAGFCRGNLRIAVDLLNSRDQAGTVPPMLGIRNQALDYLRNVLSPQRFHEAIGFCEELSKTVSRPELVMFLSSLLLFFQDVLHRTLDPGFPDLNNPDITASVDRFVKGFPGRDLYRASSLTEEAIRAIQGNASPLLVLAAYTVEIKTLLHRA
jgi:DNA polymerase-3 subunit delta'